MGDFDTFLQIYSAVVETGVFILLIFWLKFDKRQAKKRKPRQKRADIQVSVPTTVKVDSDDI